MYLSSREFLRTFLEEWVDQEEIGQQFAPEIIEHHHVVILHHSRSIQRASSSFLEGRERSLSAAPSNLELGREQQEIKA